LHTPFTTQLVGDPPDVALALVGELDIDGTSAFDVGLTSLFEVGPPVPVLDLSGLTFLGSAGLGALIRAQRTRPDLVLRGVRAAQRRVFEIAGVLGVLRIEPEPASAF
jgi:anti-sigma B factor antagonist